MAAHRLPVVVRRVADFVAGRPGIPPGSHVLVAASGGPDSTALAGALCEVAPSAGLRISLGHVQHRLRGPDDAAEDERVVRALADRWKLAVAVEDGRVAAGGNLEARARGARRRALREMAARMGATHVALGHTLDDQVETLLLRLLRGGGRGALAGMRAYAGAIVRPLLEASRADVRWYLADRALDASLDRSNADLRFARNRVRRLLVPLLASEFNPRVTAALGSLAERLRDEDDLLESLAGGEAARLGRDDTLGCGVAALPVALGRRVVRRWLAARGGGAATAGQIERVLRAAARPPSGGIVLPGPRVVVREGDALVCRDAAAEVPPAFETPVLPGGIACGNGWRLALGEVRAWDPAESPLRGPEQALLDADALGEPVIVRSPRRGDRMALANVGTRKLHDVFVDRKVPRAARSRWPVLVAGDAVLWVPGVMRGAVARVGPGTRRVLEASFRSGDKVALPLAKPCGSLGGRAASTERGSIE